MSERIKFSGCRKRAQSLLFVWSTLKARCAGYIESEGSVGQSRCLALGAYSQFTCYWIHDKQSPLRRSRIRSFRRLSRLDHKGRGPQLSNSDGDFIPSRPSWYMFVYIDLLIVYPSESESKMGTTACGYSYTSRETDVATLQSPLALWHTV
jgi:hypothetical protein